MQYSLQREPVKVARQMASIIQLSKETKEN